MALDPNLLATNLKAAFSTSPNPALKALTDAHYDQLAVIINNHILTAQVAGVVSAVAGATATQTVPVPVF
jgi:hypothetical protein